MQLSFLIIFFRLALGAMWVVSGGIKLMDLDGAVVSVSNYKFPLFDVAPGDMILGYSLPWMELVVGVLLIAGVWNRANYILSLAMFSMFLAAISYAKYYGLQINCGCFGNGESTIGWAHFVGLSLGIVGTTFLFFCKEETKNTVNSKS